MQLSVIQPFGWQVYTSARDADTVLSAPLTGLDLYQYYHVIVYKNALKKQMYKKCRYKHTMKSIL